MNSLRIKHILVIILFLLISFTGIAQKVNILVIKTGLAGISEWQILDGQYRLVFSGNEYYREDSISFSLEANNRYLLQISVSDIFNSDTTLYSLRLNGEPLLLVNSDTEPEDHFYPFYTGVKTELSKIIGGTDADIADFPWQVFFKTGNYMCGGSIISKNWVITAAHCTKNEDGTAIPVSEMSVKAGATNPYKVNQGKFYQVSEVIVHESFNEQTLLNDIALLRLIAPVDILNAEPIKLVTAADVDEGATDPGVISWVTGWGLMDVSPEVMPSVLQKVQMPIVSKAQAETIWRNIPDNFIMAGYRDGNKDACNGDSGGPMVVPVSGEYRLAGITSWGSDDCDTYSAYTEVSSFESWIRTKTGIVEYTPPVPSGDTIICQGVVTDTYSITPQSGASAYEWELFPADAGSVTGNTQNANVTWNPEYTGTATVKLRIIINDEISEWSRLNVQVVSNTKILSQPEDQILCAAETIDLDIKTEGHNLKYYWYKDGVLTNTLLTGYYNITGASTGFSGEYYCRVSGSCGTLYTDNIIVTVHPLTRINSISPDIMVSTGDNVTLEVLAGGHALTYQWKKNDELLENGDTYRIEFPEANAGNIGLYQATVTGTCGTELSSNTYVYVRKEETSKDPEIYIWPTVTHNETNVALSTDDSYIIRIFSSTGKIVTDIRNCRYQTIIYMNNYPRGLYIMKVYNRNFHWTQKIIRE